MIIIFLCIIIVIIGYKGDPHEGAEGSRRSKLFLTFLIITALYIISTSICIKMPELSWVESVIQPTYNILLLLLSGWFYIGFNPQGYQPLNEQKDNNDGYGLGDDLVFESGSGDIPPILVKKQKKKLDDKSDIFDDVDDFSDSSSHGVKLD